MSSLLTLCFFFKTFIFPLVRDAFDPSETQARSQHITQLRDARYSTPTNAAVRRWLRNIVTNSFHLSVFRAPIRGSSPARPRPMRSRGTRGGSFPSGELPSPAAPGDDKSPSPVRKCLRIFTAPTTQGRKNKLYKPRVHGWVGRATNQSIITWIASKARLCRAWTGVLLRSRRRHVSSAMCTTTALASLDECTCRRKEKTGKNGF